MQIQPIFSPGFGYGIVIGLGAAFAIIMSIVAWGLSRYAGETQDSEMQMTAKKSVRTGLLAASVVSSWTIAATLLTSTAYGYSYGVSGGWWYGAGACVQILLFTACAIELKRRAPAAHTFAEVVKVRFGPAGHFTLAFYSFLYQLFASVNLLVGAGSIFSTLTGMSADAACMLLPLGVIIYSALGGIKSTFLSDYVHTLIIYIILLISVVVVYGTSSLIGSPGEMYELLRKAALAHPIDGNQDGEYLTMKSLSGGLVGAVFVGSGFSAAVDSQLFQKAIAANPESTIGGYLLGGTAWFAIPFCLASTWGLAAAALESHPSWPTYPDRLTAAQVSEGLPMPLAALTVLGKGGAGAVIVMLFMAATSAMSSETMAVTGLVTYDIYRTYVNPKASDKQLKAIAHLTVIIFGLSVGAIACGFLHAGFSVNFIVTAIGIIVDSAVIPMVCTLTWARMNTLACVGAPILGSSVALVAWFVSTKHYSGEITIDTLSTLKPLALGNGISIIAPLIFVPLLTFIGGNQNFDWNRLKHEITAVKAHGEDHHEHMHSPEDEKETDDKEKGEINTTVVMTKEGSDELVEVDLSDHAERVLKAGRAKALWAASAMTLIFCILVPLPMYFTNYVFSKGFFIFWVVTIFLWAFYAALTIGILPLWEGRFGIAGFIRGVWKDIKHVSSRA
ncbi:Sodium:solute symporter family-domain-containing protein [Armillaria novae-zelandiae]|uniref:Sodium:solute symporter family-domain-containing protein n=1 Tax=Armillaria novae-zelandiae TaxID=153914 RepID=A0AA39NW59_9AGAR|nr:Sodium:solute symporter family-domain-containing protein [Armillaria novae-zelandiae]